MSFSVETYEITKRKGNNNSGISQEILNRIEDLENNQMNIFNEYYCDFSDDKFIDLYKSTIVSTGQGIIPKQYTNKWFDNFENDDVIDWDKSSYISVQNKEVKLDSANTTYGEFYTLPISLAKYKGFKFNANVVNPIKQNLEGTELVNSGNLWFVQGNDNYGRTWLFTGNTYDTPQNATIHLKIMNPDFTIYKQSDIPGVNFFNGGAGSQGSAGLMNGAASITFSEENLCILGLPCLSYSRNGMYCENQYYSAAVYGRTITNITFVDENGNSSIKYSADSGNVHANNNNNTRLGRTSNKSKIIVWKNKVIYYTPQVAYYRYSEWNNGGRCLFISLEPAIVDGERHLNDVNIGVLNYELRLDFIADNNVYHGSTYTWMDRSDSEFFTIGDSIYFFSSTYAYSGNYSLGDTSFFLVEVKPNISANNFALVNSYRLKCTAPTTAPLMYTYGGCNGIYYSKKHNFLYVFSNPTNDKTLTINRYEIDWTSKVTNANNSNNYNANNTIEIKNQKTKTIQLMNTSYNADYTNHYFDKLKVYENENTLQLMYGEDNVQSLKRCLMHLCINLDMDVVNSEMPLYHPMTTGLDFVQFDLIKTDELEKIIYTTGNKDNFVVTTAPGESNMFSVKNSTVISTVKWYYANNKDLQWKAVNLGDQVTLPIMADDIRFKAVLQSAFREDSSPEIKSLSVETWDNNFEDSRKSDYYSNRIESVENDGKAIITADYDLNDGAIDWFVSFNGGISFAPTALGVEFAYTHISAPDFRVKAEMYVKDNASRLPVIRSYTVKSNHIVLHSDLEEIQINLMKTNFKIDTYTNASKNGLFKMSIDTFSNDNNIDATNSDYLWYGTLGSVGGNYLQTKPELINDNVKTILLTTDEVLDNSYPNSHINYMVSVDGGITFIPIVPNIKQQVTNTNSSSSSVIFKAVFYDNAKISAWGWAWN